AWGETTDGMGFLDLMRARGREPATQRVVLLGAGGAARSLAVALSDIGSPDLVASARHPLEAAPSWRDIPAATLVSWRSTAEAEAIARAGVVVNATPLGGENEIAPFDKIPRAALVVDLVYGREVTAWVRRARAARLEAYDGLGLLAFQARRSLALWTGHEPPIDALTSAIGWP